MSTHVCTRCGQEFEYSGNVKRCPVCRTACAICGKPTSHYQKHCDRCRYHVEGDHSKMVKCKHPDCKTMTRYDPRRTGHCWEHTDWASPRRRTAAYNRTFKTKPKHLRYRRQTEYSVDCICKVCGKPFKAQLATVKYRPNPTGYCCSSRCVGVWAAKHTPNRDTSIERAIEQALKERQWLYEKQVPLCGITLVDFYLPDRKTVIYCDGDYWHSFPERKAQDQTQTRVLEEHGHHVYRFSGSEIRQSPHGCLDQISVPTVPVFRQLSLPTAES